MNYKKSGKIQYIKLLEVMIMLMTQAWYEAIFSGVLEIGLDREKVQQLEDESFLYFNSEMMDSYERQQEK